MNLKYEIDPYQKFTNVDEDTILNALGFIPSWAANPEFINQPLKEALDTQYGFGLYEITGGTIEDGIFKYPGDPDLYPLFKLYRGNEILYQYEHAIVAIIQEDSSAFVTRMD